MSVNIGRKQFFRGDLSGKNLPWRPPWSLAEQVFVEQCERCDDCVKQCPEKILLRGRSGFPEVDFSRGGCTFCGECLIACKGRALVGKVEQPQNAWRLRASIDAHCLALQRVVCRACGESCDEQAIRFKLALGGVSRPQLDASLCTGCGECFAVCPVRAIKIAPLEPPDNNDTEET